MSEQSRLTEFPDNITHLRPQTSRITKTEPMQAREEPTTSFKRNENKDCSGMRKVHSVKALKMDFFKGKEGDQRETFLTAEFSRNATSSSSLVSWSRRQVHGSNTNICRNVDGEHSMRKVASWSGPQLSRRRRPSFSPSCNAEPEEETTLTIKLVPRILAKISIAILVLGALIDLSSKSNDSYLLRASSSANRPALGSAAIKSVTEALSPILPFTGGIDLRKEDYWTSASPLQSFTSVVGQVWEAFVSSKNISSRANKETSSTSQQSLQRILSHEAILSSPEGFISKDDIAQLTLEDVSQLIVFATESNRITFDESRFIGRQLPRVRKVIYAVNDAVQKSRGRGVLLSTRPGAPNKASQPGSMDTLMFCAVIRIFGEWRILRQVPDGFKGYAVGMNLGYKDIVQNIAKVELAVHSWLDASEVPSNGVIRSPTVIELLKYEFLQGIHPNLPRLKDRTAAMGLLWVCRQLQYQNQVYENTITKSDRFPSTTDAVAAAYKKVYNEYHGWAVQKIFTYSFQAAPEPEVIFRHMNPHKMKELREADMTANHRSKIADNEVVLQPEKEENPVISWLKKLENDLEKNPVVSWVKKIGDEWRRKVDEWRRKMLPWSDNNNDGLAQNRPDDEYFITAEMTKNASENINAFLLVARPLVADLGLVLERFNMNDPTKV